MKFAEQLPEGREASKILVKARAAMNRIELAVRESPRPGYRENACGSYFREESVNKVLILLDEAESKSHLDGAVRFARAGILSWAGDYERAAEEYQLVVKTWPIYRQPARCGLAAALGWLGRLAEAQHVIDEYNAVLAASLVPGMPRLDFARLGLRTGT